MSLRIGVISGYASQVYVLILGMAFVPIYIRLIGAEAYGLVGFFTMLQAWFGLLDLGLSATASREATLYKSRQIAARDFADLYRGLNWIFGIISGVGSVALLLCAPWIAQNWLVVDALEIGQVIFAVQVMAICVGLKLMGGVYRGVITGNELLSWLNLFNAVLSTLKFVGVLLSMQFWGHNVVVFFLHQLMVALLECVVLRFKARALVPSTSTGKLSQTVGSVWTRMKFMLSMAFVSVVWVMVSQLDKLVLSGVLSLKDYAYFTVAMVVANSITFLTGPVSAAVMPRMTRLHAEQSQPALIVVYRQATRYLMALIGPVSAVLVIYGYELLLVWTGDPSIAEHAAPILRLYAAGNAVLAMGSFAYYLQYAKGQMRYHVYSSVLFITLLMPALILAATHFGAEGAGWVWLGFNVLYLLVWVAFVHRQLAPGLHASWLIRDGLSVVVPSVLLLLVFRNFFQLGTDRWIILGQLVALSFVTLLISFAVLREFRHMFFSKFLSPGAKKLESDL